jgi:signal transduction histidine kinase
VERKCRRLAEQLHDGVVQELTAAALFLDSAMLHVPAEDTATRELLDQAIDALRKTMTSCRQVMDGLVPSPHGADDIRTLLGSLARRATGRAADDAVHVNVPARICRDEPDKVLLALRVAEELLDNVRRHAGGLLERVVCAVDDGNLVVEVTDRGGGEMPQPQQWGPGQRTLQARLAAVGGELTVGAQAGSTVVTARIPVGDP